MCRNKQQGFTIIELLIAITLMAVISAIVAVRIGPGSRQSARDAQRRVDVNAIGGTLEMFRNDRGRYPGAAELAAQLVPNYISAIPVDPRTGAAYPYTPAPAGCTVAGVRCTTFSVCAIIERPPGVFCVNNP